MPILLNLFLTFAKIGAFTFGGGYAMISLIDHECCEKKKWITNDEMMEITVIAESTPGPVAINFATYTGYKQKGFLGAVVATLGMVLPSFIILILISLFFDRFLEFEIVTKAFKGIRVAVGLLIVRAALKLIMKLLKKKEHKWINISFFTFFFVVMLVLNILNISFSTIWLILISGSLGYFVITFSEKKGGNI